MTDFWKCLWSTAVIPVRVYQLGTRVLNFQIFNSARCSRLRWKMIPTCRVWLDARRAVTGKHFAIGINIFNWYLTTGNLVVFRSLFGNFLFLCVSISFPSGLAKLSCNWSLLKWLWCCTNSHQSAWILIKITLSRFPSGCSIFPTTLFCGWKKDPVLEFYVDNESRAQNIRLVVQKTFSLPFCISSRQHKFRLFGHVHGRFFARSCSILFWWAKVPIELFKLFLLSDAFKIFLLSSFVGFLYMQ